MSSRPAAGRTRASSAKNAFASTVAIAGTGSGGRVNSSGSSAARGTVKYSVNSRSPVSDTSARSA
ncbi:hypothetical protein [Streptomyces sp. NPDC056160]|uniref:hypothetical protein n=1 Tax=Streptomyces sp. NPDC056160 TaxID=3345731 RepID=UPI0035D55318